MVTNPVHVKVLKKALIGYASVTKDLLRKIHQLKSIIHAHATREHNPPPWATVAKPVDPKKFRNGTDITYEVTFVRRRVVSHLLALMLLQDITQMLPSVALGAAQETLLSISEQRKDGAFEEIFVLKQ